MAQQDTVVAEEREAQGKVGRRRLVAGAAALVVAAMAVQTSEQVAATSGSGDQGTVVMGSYPGPGSNTSNKPTWIRASSFTFPVGSGSAVLTVDASLNGQTTSIDGVSGIGANNYTGVLGTGGANGGAGVLGFGGSAGTAADSGFGVLGVASGANNPVPGTFGCGVYGSGFGASRPGVVGKAQTSDGVQGATESGRGVYGSAAGGGGGIGVYGQNSNAGSTSHGIVGVSQNGHGLIGTSNVTGTGPGLAGLVGFAPNGAYAGLFYGQLLSSSTIRAVGGFISGVPGPSNTMLSTYAVQSPEPYIEDFGEGKLVNGRAEVKLDSALASAVDADKMHIFVTPHGDYQIHVADRSAGSFVAQASSSSVAAGSASRGIGGTSSINGGFSYRVIARLKGGARLAAFTPPTGTPPVAPTGGKDTPVKVDPRSLPPVAREVGH